MIWRELQFEMDKRKYLLYTIKKQRSLGERLKTWGINLLPFLIILIMYRAKWHYLFVLLLLFVYFLFRKQWITAGQEYIEVYYDYLVYCKQKRELELDFYNIYHIDVDIQEGSKEKLYMREMVFLNEQEEELLSIDGQGYEKDQLDFLIHRILEIQSLSVNNVR